MAFAPPPPPCQLHARHLALLCRLGCCAPVCCLFWVLLNGFFLLSRLCSTPRKFHAQAILRQFHAAANDPGRDAPEDSYLLHRPYARGTRTLGHSMIPLRICTQLLREFPVDDHTGIDGVSVVDNVSPSSGGGLRPEEHLCVRTWVRAREFSACKQSVERAARRRCACARACVCACVHECGVCACVAGLFFGGRAQ